jgi:signal peptidase II
MVTQATATSSPNVRSRAFLRAGLLVIAVLALDQLSKRLVISGISVGDQHKFLPGIQFVHVRNTGVAFGFLSGGGALVLLFTFAALAVLLTYFVRHPTRPYLWVPTGLLVGGALGNLLDRILNGAVTDFIKLPYWPAFNVADMSITFGVLALLWVVEGKPADGR